MRSQKSAQDEETPLQTRGDMKHCSLSVHLHWVHTAEADPEPEAGSWARVGLTFLLDTVETQAEKPVNECQGLCPHCSPFRASVMETVSEKKKGHRVKVSPLESLFVD